MNDIITDSEIKKLANDCHKDVCRPPELIYHYTDEHIVEKILTNDGIEFRMTRASDFSDIYEGKSIEIYYDMALEALEKDGIILPCYRRLLNTVRLPEKRLAIIDVSHKPEEPRAIASSVRMTPYILCFSKNKCAPYVFQNYTRDEKKGYCLEFYGHDIALKTTQLSFEKGYKFKLYEVLYGNEIIRAIKNLICEMMSCFIDFNEQIIEMFFLGILAGKLQDLQYSTKLGKYREENEVRLIPCRLIFLQRRSWISLRISLHRWMQPYGITTMKSAVCKLCVIAYCPG